MKGFFVIAFLLAGAIAAYLSQVARENVLAHRMRGATIWELGDYFVRADFALIALVLFAIGILIAWLA